MVEQTTPRPTLRIEGAELDLTYEVPSVFCNKMYLTLTPVTGRLTFAEAYENKSPKMRASVTLAIHDLLSLRDLITQMLDGKTEAIPVEVENVPQK